MALGSWTESVLNDKFGIKAEVKGSVASVPETFSQMKRSVYRSNPPDWCIKINIHAFQRLWPFKINFNVDILNLFPSEPSLQRNIDDLGI